MVLNKNQVWTRRSARWFTAIVKTAPLPGVVILAVVLLLLAASVIAQKGLFENNPLPSRVIAVAGITVTVEVAITPEERGLGLMNREELPEDGGMLFIYRYPQELRFWMRNTRIPLDIAFIDHEGIIISIQPMERTESDDHTVSPAPALYALEMNLGWFEKNGVQVGDRVEF